MLLGEQRERAAGAGDRRAGRIGGAEPFREAGSRMGTTAQVRKMTIQKLLFDARFEMQGIAVKRQP